MNVVCMLRCLIASRMLLNFDFITVIDALTYISIYI